MVGLIVIPAKAEIQEPKGFAVAPSARRKGGRAWGRLWTSASAGDDG